MSDTSYTHVAFADESNWNQGRFRSISLVSTETNHARMFHKELTTLCERHGRVEYKWTEMKKRYGIALTDFFFKRVDQMRVDVLTWDTEDSRHGNLPGRDDKANFARMYYHLLHNVLKRRWPNDARWLLCPDQQKEVDWLSLKDYLDGHSWNVEYDDMLSPFDGITVYPCYTIEEVRCVCSKEYRLVQMADLFAGLAAYSYSAFIKYQQWKTDQDNLLPLDYGERLTLSKSDRERLPILHHVCLAARSRKLQVSLESTCGLCSRNPSTRLNFWLYKPQRKDDKAPVRPYGNVQ